MSPPIIRMKFLLGMVGVGESEVAAPACAGTAPSALAWILDDWDSVTYITRKVLDGHLSSVI
jgi:hypothetical protein